MAMLENYVLGSWIKGDGAGQELYNAVTGDVIATAYYKRFRLSANNRLRQKYR